MLQRFVALKIVVANRLYITLRQSTAFHSFIMSVATLTCKVASARANEGKCAQGLTTVDPPRLNIWLPNGMNTILCWYLGTSGRYQS